MFKVKVLQLRLRKTEKCRISANIPGSGQDGSNSGEMVKLAAQAVRKAEEDIVVHFSQTMMKDDNLKTTEDLHLRLKVLDLGMILGL